MWQDVEIIHVDLLLVFYLSSLPALIRSYLKEYLIRKHMVIREGVVRAGKQNLLDTVYVEPQISTSGFGGVDPSHELRPLPALQFPSEDTFVSLNNLFRLQRDDGKPVRTVVTTGIPGIGLSVSVSKFVLDWAEMRANKVRYEAQKFFFPDIVHSIQMNTSSTVIYWAVCGVNRAPLLCSSSRDNDHCCDFKWLQIKCTDVFFERNLL